MALKRKHLLLLSMLLLLPAVWTIAPALSRGYMPRVVEFSVKDKSTDARTASAHGFKSKVLKTGKQFNLVGLSWVGTKEPRIFLRSRLKGRGWSGWYAVPTASDHRPDGRGSLKSNGKYVSDPVWVGDADRIQYRTVDRARVGSVRLHFVNSKGTATRLQRARTGLRNVALSAVSSMSRVFGAAGAGADSGRPDIVPRADWGASQCRPRRGSSYGSVQVAVVHHTVNSNNYGPGDSGSVVLGICRYHKNTRGWNDIGYNFLVDKYGKVFEGRAGGVDSAVVGAHAAGYNSNSFGVGNIGDFTSVQHSSEGINALSRLIAWKLAIHGVPAVGTTQVNSKNLNNISGHRDVNSTSCPGNSLYGQLPDLRARTDAVQRGITLTPYSLSVQADPQPLEYGSRTTLNGRLIDTASGSPLVYERIRLDVSSSKKWRRFRTVTTDENGNWSTTVGPSAKRSYRAIYVATDGSGTTSSDRLTLKILPKLTVQVAGGRTNGSITNFRRGRVARVSASIQPERRKVILVVYRSSRSKYGRVLRKRLSVRGNGSLKSYFRLARTGRYRVRIYYKGDRRVSRNHIEFDGIRVR